MNYDSKIALLIFFSFLTFFIMTTGGHPYFDENMVFEVAKSIVYDGKFYVEPEIVLQYWEGSFKIGADEKFYVIFSPGWTISLVPFVFFEKVFSLPSLTWALYNSISVAGICSFTFLLSRKIGYTRNLALILVLILGLTTILWQYSKTGTGSPWSTLFLLISIYFLYTFRGHENKRLYFYSGIFISLAIVIRYDFFLFVPSLIVFIKITSHQKFPLTQIGSFLIPLFILMILILSYNTVIWGSPLESGYGHFASLSQHNTLDGIFGLLISPYNGLFLFVPVTLLLFKSFSDFYKKEKHLAFVFISIFVISLLFFGTLSFWYGGHTWGPRYMFATIPLIIITLGASITQRKKWFDMLVISLTSIGFFVNLIGSLFKSQLAIQKFYAVSHPNNLTPLALFSDPSHNFIWYQIQIALDGRFDLAFLHNDYWIFLVGLSVLLGFLLFYLFKIIKKSNLQSNKINNNF